MADYTPEQVEKLAEFARWATGYFGLGGKTGGKLEALGILKEDGTLVDWLRPDDWAMRAAREWFKVTLASEETVRECTPALAAIIRKHAEDRT